MHRYQVRCCSRLQGVAVIHCHLRWRTFALKCNKTNFACLTYKSNRETNDQGEDQIIVVAENEEMRSKWIAIMNIYCKLQQESEYPK